MYQWHSYSTKFSRIRFNTEHSDSWLWNNWEMSLCDSLFSNVIGYWLNYLGSIPFSLFATVSTLALWHIQYHILRFELIVCYFSWHPCRGEKSAGMWSWPRNSVSIEVKKTRSITSTFQHVFMACWLNTEISLVCPHFVWNPCS